MQEYSKIKKQLNSVSCSFCIAKWAQLTLYLQTGYNHSCHHPSPHKIPLDELKKNYKALHNTSYKKEQMQKMLIGERPSECQYCWNVEDLGDSYYSDRIYKSAHEFSQRKFNQIVQNGTNDIEPSYLEISFSNTCQLKCGYCSPDISSSWMQEVEKYGGYPTSNNFNDLGWFKQNGKIPYKQSEENPYVEAFWKWWPELYPKLHTLRLTGGEPLLSKDVWKVIDSLIENPNKNLVFCINTNLLVSDHLIDRLIDSLNKLDGRVKELQIFTSGEAVGSANEYIRYGTDYKKWQSNLEKLLNETNNVLVANMTTVNLLSVGSYAEFIRYLLKLRGRYNKNASFDRIQFMTNYLRFPNFLALDILDNFTKEIFYNSMYELIDESNNSKSNYEKLTNEQINQIYRLVEYMKTTSIDDSTIHQRRNDFYRYIIEYDKRRNLNFLNTFPELKTFYNICQETLKIQKT